MVLKTQLSISSAKKNKISSNFISKTNNVDGGLKIQSAVLISRFKKYLYECSTKTKNERKDQKQIYFFIGLVFYFSIYT